MLLSYGHDSFSDLPTDYELTPEDLRAAWRELGRSIMADFAEDRHRAGQRPYSWWVVEQGVNHRPSREEQLQYLRAHNLLTETERRVLAERQRIGMV